MALVFATVDEYKDYLSVVFERLYANIDANTGRSDGTTDDAGFLEDAEVAEATLLGSVECAYVLESLTDRAKLLCRGIVRSLIAYAAYQREDYAAVPEDVDKAYTAAVARMLAIADGTTCLSVNADYTDEDAQPAEVFSPIFVKSCKPTLTCRDEYHNGCVDDCEETTEE